MKLKHRQYSDGGAIGLHFDMWAFPRTKPQLFADSSVILAAATRYYGFGRRFPVLSHKALCVSLRLPGLRLYTACEAGFEPSCGWENWYRLLILIERCEYSDVTWAFFKSQWKERNFSAIGLDQSGVAKVLAQVQLKTELTFHPEIQAQLFRVPRILRTDTLEDWSIRCYEAMPPYHRPVLWDAGKICDISAEVSSALEKVLDRPFGIPSHWKPIHGDMTPSNLREDHQNRIWLIDWEDVTWAPPLADVVYFGVNAVSMRECFPARLASQLSRSVTDLEHQFAEAAAFWLEHQRLRAARDENLQVSDGKAADIARVSIVIRALEMLAESPNEFGQSQELE